MPDAYGNFKGVGWSQKRSDAWERVFRPLAPGDRVEVVAEGYVGRRGVVDHVNATWVYVQGAQLVGDDPAGFRPEELRRYAESAEENPNRESSGPTA